MSAWSVGGFTTLRLVTLRGALDPVYSLNSCLMAGSAQSVEQAETSSRKWNENLRVRRRQIEYDHPRQGRGKV